MILFHLLRETVPIFARRYITDEVA